MTVRKSSFLKSQLMGSSGDVTGDGLSAVLNKFFVDGYQGIQPASADDAPGQTPIITWSLNSGVSTDEDNGGLWLAPSNVGVLQRDTTVNLTGAATASGNLGWIRLRLAAEGSNPNTADTGKTKARVDMSVATFGGDLTVSTTAIESGVTYPFGPLIITAI